MLQQVLIVMIDYCNFEGIICFCHQWHQSKGKGDQALIENLAYQIAFIPIRFLNSNLK
jgi:hypothetical protein